MSTLRIEINIESRTFHQTISCNRSRGQGLFYPSCLLLLVNVNFAGWRQDTCIKEDAGLEEYSVKRDILLIASWPTGHTTGLPSEIVIAQMRVV